MDAARIVSSTTRAEFLLRKRRFSEAAQIYTGLLPQIGQDPRHLVNFGGALIELSRFPDAARVLGQVVQLDPTRWSAWANLGIALLEQQRYDESVAAFEHAIRLNPTHVPSLSGAGVALRRVGRPRDAIRLFDLALGIAPGDAELRHYRAMALLAAGDYAEGFSEHEWRLRAGNVTPTMIPAPQWAGEAYQGRTLLLQGEDGFGDMLQFARYLPLAAQRGGTLLVVVPVEVKHLLSRMEGVASVLSPSDPMPAVDYQCPMMSLPHVFGTTIETIPASGGYLLPDPQRVRYWKARVCADESALDAPVALRVGLVWSGGIRPWHRDNMLWNGRRSTTLRSLAPLSASAPRSIFYSLQVGPAGQEAREPPAGMVLFDHTSELASFDETAALISNLDAVVSVDTSTAHLAGAIGKRLMLLSCFDHCWRWLIGRTDSPWYDGVRIYQQPQPQDWSTPIDQIARDLAILESWVASSKCGIEHCC